MKYGIMYYRRTDNIGDDFQTYAAKRFLKQIDYYIDREAMDGFIPEQKDYVALIMNGWYMNNKLTWPPSPYIYPHLVSMHFTNAGLFNVGDIYIKGKIANYLNKFEKVGCRDQETIKRLEKYGVKNCYFTGCLTLTLNKFPDVEKQDYICAVDLSEDLVNKIKQSTNKEVKVMTQNNYDLVNMTFEERMKETEKFLKTFQGASAIITRRLHATLPSIALGTPVILLKQDGYENEKDRFQDFSSFAGNTFTIKEFLQMDISDVINNPKPNSDAYLEIRNNLIKSCEDFIESCEKSNMDTSKLPDIEEYRNKVKDDAEWNDEIGASVAENEKLKQKDYVEKWDEREVWLKKVEKDREDLYKENDSLRQQKDSLAKENDSLVKENEKLQQQINQFFSSKLGRLYKKLHDK